MSTNNAVEIDILADGYEKEAFAHLEPSIGVRAVFFVDGNVCLVHYPSTARYTLPGGGKETDESFDEAIRREVLEETGYTVTSAKKTLILKEHFEDSVWHHHYYYVEVSKQNTQQSLTQEETELGLNPVFKPLEEALEILAFQPVSHPHHAQINNRELLGLMHSIEK